MGLRAQQRRKAAAEARQPDYRTPLLYSIWIQLCVGYLLWWTLAGGAAWAAYVYVPPLLTAGGDGRDVDMPAELPSSWPVDELTLPPGAVRAQLPERFRTMGREYTIDGQRFDDDINYGHFPQLWMVSFTSADMPENVYNHLLKNMHEPLYRTVSLERYPEATQFVFLYCDGDTYIYISGPGPFSTDPVYTLKVMAYDH
jgi:hypothetical protein